MEKTDLNDVDATPMQASAIEAGKAASTPTTAENHNRNKIHRRNVTVTESTSFTVDDKDSATEGSCDRVPLVILPDTMRAWHDGDAPPRIPDADITASKKQNGVLSLDDETDAKSNDVIGTSADSLVSREKTKIGVIRGSVANPDLTLRELRLLGCSSEGFVNGSY